MSCSDRRAALAALAIEEDDLCMRHSRFRTLLAICDRDWRDMLVAPHRKRLGDIMNGGGFYGKHRVKGLLLHIRRLNGFLHVEFMRGMYCPLLDEMHRAGRPFLERIVAEYSETLVCYIVEELDKDRRRRAAAI